MLLDRLADAAGEFAPFAHRVEHPGHARLEVAAQAAVEHFGALRQIGPVGDVEVEIRRNGDRFIASDAVTEHVFAIEIHVDRGVIGLRHPVLQSGGDVQLIPLGGEDEVGQLRRFDGEAVEAEHCAHGGGDDRRGPGQAEPVRDRAPVAHGEVLRLQLESVPMAVVEKDFRRRLEQPDSAVVAVEGDVGGEFLQIAKTVVVAFGGQELQLRRLIEFHLRRVVAEDEGDGLAVVSVGGVPHQSGARVGCGFDDHAILTWFSIDV